MKRVSIYLITLLFFASCSIINFQTPNNEKKRIQPYEDNSWYWQYKGEPVLLIGGTGDDNPFNQPNELKPDGLESHLDLLKSVGGNYIRNTMSSRDKGALWPFKKLKNGKYDLEKWNPEYWERFDHLLNLAEERNIIVQIEIWDPWDYFADSEEGGWSSQPFNPVNNVNYTLQESRLKREIDYRTQDEPTGHNFFHTVPELENNQKVLKYQEAFVAKILEHALSHPNVLYCLSNEIGEPIEWSVYWAKFIHKKADKKGIEVQVADMRRANNINSGDQRYLQDHPGLFTFLDISQNNGGGDWDEPNESHWNPIIRLRRYISNDPRPMNNTKIYGSEDGGWGGQNQALQKFWRNIFAGCASARFHRPPSGPGLSEIAQGHIKSMRMLTEKFDIFSCQPDNGLLEDRTPNEAYCMADPGRQYAVYFPSGGQVTLKIPQNQKWNLQWLNIRESKWKNQKQIEPDTHISLKAPGNGHWVALISQ